MPGSFFYVGWCDGTLFYVERCPKPQHLIELFKIWMRLPCDDISASSGFAFWSASLLTTLFL